MKTWRYFWELIRYRPRYYATDLTGVTVRFALTTVTGLILRAYFNGLSNEGGLAVDAWTAVGLELLHIILVLVSLYAAVMGYVNFTQHGMALVIRNMFARILQMPGARPLPVEDDGEPMSTGKVISTLRDDAREMVHAIIIIDDTVALSVTAIVAFAIMLNINVAITLGTFLPLALVIFGAQRLGARARRYRAASRKATSEVTAMIADMFNATQAIKVANAEERVVQRFRQVNAQRREAMVRDRLLTQFVDALSNGTVDVGVGLVLLLAAQSMLAGEFTIGDFALFASYIWPATQLMRSTGNLITRYKQVGVSVQRMELIMQGLPEGAVVEHNPVYMSGDYPRLTTLEKTPSDILQHVRVRGLTCRLGNNAAQDGEPPEAAVHGIESVDLNLARGSFTVITGRIGAGKSTLLRTLLGLLPAQAGVVTWNEMRVEDPSLFFVPPRAAFTGQVPRLFSEALANNILLGLDEGSVNMGEAIRLAVFERDVEEMEQGLQTPVGPRGVRLSGGQIQRAAAARMYVRDAELLVFDDLSSALDVETERLLWERLFALTPRPTCLVVSHRREALQRADQIVILKEGRVEDRGALSELLERSAEMRALWYGGDEDVS
ncbi:MAG: ATP-binding cassette domain-containing protein [Chloroflexota bacterium]